jgi:hypothetical protein
MRLFLALTLAVWSPAWTCCCLLGATCGDRGAPHSEAGGAAARPCCAAKETAEPAQPPPGRCCATGGRRGPATDCPTCRCGDHQRDLGLVRAAVLPPADQFSLGDFLAPPPPAGLVSLDLPLPALAARAAREHAGGMVRADSLHARCCLLTI